jgi:hypothetical protein
VGSRILSRAVNQSPHSGPGSEPNARDAFPRPGPTVNLRPPRQAYLVANAAMAARDTLPIMPVAVKVYQCDPLMDAMPLKPQWRGLLTVAEIELFAEMSLN